MKKNKYKIEVSFCEKKRKHNHRINEEWECGDMTSFKNILRDVLDLVCTLNGDVVEPSLENTKKSLIGFMNEIEIKKEYNRQRKMYKIYKSIIDDFDKLSSMNYVITKNIDKNTKLFVTNVCI